MVDLELLKHNPGADVIANSLIYLSGQKPLDLEATIVIVKYIIPVYPSLKKNGQETLFEIFSHSFNMLTHTLNFIKLLRKAPEERIYKQFLIDALSNEPSCLHNYIELSKNNLETKMVQSAFFGSKVLNALSGLTDILEYLDLLKAQILYVLDIDNISEKKVYADLISALLLLHPVYSRDLLFGDLIFSSRERFIRFGALFLLGSFNSQQRLANNIIIYFDKVTTSANVNTVASVIQYLGAEYFSYDALLKLNNVYVKAAIIKLLPEKSKTEMYTWLMDKFQRKWDDPDDEKVCELLVAVLGEFTSDTKQNLAHQASFLDAVTSRLSADHSRIRERTMFIAKIVTEGELKYESGFEISIPAISVSQFEHIDVQSLQTVPVSDIEKKDGLVLADIRALSLSGGEEEDERHIVFLKDLLQEFERSGKNSQEHVRLLKSTVKLIRQKADFISEVEYYSTPLLAIIANLSNNLEEEDFEEWKINALVSIISVVPSKVTDILRILFVGDISLQQRLSILSVIGLTARELRGLDDQMIIKPESDFPTRRLPWDQATNDNGKCQIMVGQDKETSNLKDGRVVWKSRKLNNVAGKPKAGNRFLKHASAFFFPLAHGWLNGIDMGSYDHLFKKHYISTLQIIITAAFPHHEFHSMTDLMTKILEDATQQGIPTEY